MVKLKNKELMKIDNALAYLSQQQTPAWYGVAKNIRIITPFLVEIESSKQDIYRKYAEKDDFGNPIIKEGQVCFENKEEADKIWDSLMNEEVDINFYKIKINTLEGVSLDAFVMEALLETVLIEE